MTDKEKADQCYSMVLMFFKNNKKKTDLWFKCENANLGGGCPNDLIKKGRVDKLLRFIQCASDENGWKAK